jgi:hypothetical protein
MSKRYKVSEKLVEFNTKAPCVRLNTERDKNEKTNVN